MVSRQLIQWPRSERGSLEKRCLAQEHGTELGGFAGAGAGVGGPLGCSGFLSGVPFLPSGTPSEADPLGTKAEWG